jgi:hypothetical protein
MRDAAGTFAGIGQGLLSADYAAAAVKPRLGVFAPFVDPNEPAPTANVFWSPDALSLTLSGTATRAPNSDLCLERLPSVRQLMIDAKGTQHLKFRSDRRTLSVILDGVAVAVTPARVLFHIDGLEHIERASDGLAKLGEILRHNIARSDDGTWTATSLAMRDALIALDGHRVRASYRDIATVIFGAERTAEAWRGASTALKDRIRRALKRGLELVAGGYRELL